MNIEFAKLPKNVYGYLLYHGFKPVTENTMDFKTGLDDITVTFHIHGGFYSLTMHYHKCGGESYQGKIDELTPEKILNYIIEIENKLWNQKQSNHDLFIESLKSSLETVKIMDKVNDSLQHNKKS